MNDQEIKALAEAIATQLQYEVVDQVKEHNRILKGKNGDIGLVSKVNTLEQNWKGMKTFFGIGGGAIIVDVFLRVWAWIQITPPTP